MGNCQNSPAISTVAAGGYDEVKDEATTPLNRNNCAVTNENKSGSNVVEPSQTDLTLADSCASVENPAQCGTSPTSKKSANEFGKGEDAVDYVQFDSSKEESATPKESPDSSESSQSEPTKEEEEKELSIVPSEKSTKTYRMAIQAPSHPEKSPRHNHMAFPVEKGKPLELGRSASSIRNEAQTGAIVTTDQSKEKSQFALAMGEGPSEKSQFALAMGEAPSEKSQAIAMGEAPSEKSQFAIPAKDGQSMELLAVSKEDAIATDSKDNTKSPWALSPRSVPNAIVSTNENKNQWVVESSVEQPKPSQTSQRQRRSRKEEHGKEKYPNGLGYPPNFPPL